VITKECADESLCLEKRELIPNPLEMLHKVPTNLIRKYSEASGRLLRIHLRAGCVDTKR
jgi:hypothetical protein